MISQDVLSPPQKSTHQYQQDDVSLERIPDKIHQEIVDMFAADYHFKNGEKMRINNYFVKISRSLSDIFVTFIQEVIKGLSNNQFPNMPTPHGFKPHAQNLTQTERDGGFSLGSFDMAVTNDGLQNIEFQSLATYPISAAKISHHLLDNMPLEDAYVFADSPTTNWKSFINLYDTIIGGNQQEGIVIIDRNIAAQKTNFEFFATQKELNIPIEIVDMKDLFEKTTSFFIPRPPINCPEK